MDEKLPLTFLCASADCVGHMSAVCMIKIRLSLCDYLGQRITDCT